MGKDGLEDYIKDTLYTHESKVDTDEVWKRLQKKEPKRRPFWMLFFMGGIFLIGIGSLYLFAKADADVAVTEEYSLNNKNRTIEEFNTQPKKNSSNIDLEETKNSITNTASVIEKTEKDHTSESISTIESQKPTNRNLKEKLATSSAAQNFNPTKQVQNHNKSSNSTHVLEKYLPIKKESSILKKPTQSSSVISGGKNQDPINSISLEPLLLTSLFSDRDKIKLDHSFLPALNEEVNNDKWQLNVGLFSSYYGGQRTLAVDTTNASFKARNDNEEFVEAWDAGLDIYFKHRSGIFFGSGIAYRQINDRSRLAFDNEELVVPTPEELEGQGVFVNTFTTNSVRYNKFRMLDVPVFLGYEKSIAKHDLSLRGGININIGTRVTGHIIDEVLVDSMEQVSFVNVNTRDQSLFKSNIGVSYQFELGYGYSFDNGLKISLHPTYRYYKESFNNVDFNPTEQRYQHLGFKLRAAMQF